MTYTADTPTNAESSDELRARIPGWGADLDPHDRPSVPRLRQDPTGAHWEFPDRQQERWPRERSIEHKFLTPVFGTSCPPRGLSGAVRKYAYRRFSEGRAAHWLLLIAADRIDVAESRALAVLHLHPDSVLTETGIRAELTHHGFRSRVGQGRADTRHQLVDPVIVLGPSVLRAAGGYLAIRALVRRRRCG